MPGLTRDRREGEADIAGHKVTLVDTAGLEEAAPGSIAARMRAQSEAAITRADLVLFVLDARDGVVPTDAAFARAVRRSGQARHPRRQQVRGTRRCRGLLRGLPAGAGRADRHLGRARRRPRRPRVRHPGGARLEAGSQAQARRRGRAGDRGGGERRGAPHPPRHRRAPQRRQVDAGQRAAGRGAHDHRDRSRASRAMRSPPTSPGATGPSACSTRRGSGARRASASWRRSSPPAMPCAPSASPRWWCCWSTPSIPSSTRTSRSADLVAEEGRALVVAVNKWDLVTDKQKRLKELRETLEERLTQVAGVSLVAISALADSGLERLMSEVLRSYEIWNRRVPTPHLNRWLGEALERHAAACLQGPPGEDPVHDAGLRAAADLRRLLRRGPRPCRRPIFATSPTACARPSACRACRSASSCARATTPSRPSAAEASHQAAMLSHFFLRPGIRLAISSAGRAALK